MLVVLKRLTVFARWGVLFSEAVAAGIKDMAREMGHRGKGE